MTENTKNMDLKDIIKWFIPCFHILVGAFKSRRQFDVYLFFIILFLNSNIFLTASAVIDNVDNNNYYNRTLKLNNHNLVNVTNTKNNVEKFNLMEIFMKKENLSMTSDVKSQNSSKMDVYQGSARTFGRPVKKLAAALIPLSFQIGAASTWAVVAALLGLKTLGVALLILKLLLVAGAAKFGSLFSKLGHQQHESWTPPQKEIHLHIHNTPHGVHESFGDWSRDGSVVSADTTASQQNQNVVSNVGPAAINTPYGSYVRIGPPSNVRKR